MFRNTNKYSNESPKSFLNNYLIQKVNKFLKEK